MKSKHIKPAAEAVIPLLERNDSRLQQVFCLKAMDLYL